LSKHDPAYIDKFQPRTFERSECCKAPIEWGETRAGRTSPPEPVPLCSSCGAKCDRMEIPEDEEEGR